MQNVSDIMIRKYGTDFNCEIKVLCRKDNHEWINWYVAYVFRGHLRMHLSIRDGFYIQTKDLGDGAF